MDEGLRMVIAQGREARAFRYMWTTASPICIGVEAKDGVRIAVCCPKRTEMKRKTA